MKLLIVLSSLIFLIGCEKVEDEVVPGSSTTSLIKEYKVCENTGSESFYEKITLYPSGGLKISTTYYDDVDCKAGTEIELNITTGDYNYNQITGKFTEKTRRLQVAFPTTSEVNQRNSDAYCSFTNWERNVYKDITDNEDCYGGTIYSDSLPFEYNALLTEDILELSLTYERIR